MAIDDLYFDGEEKARPLVALMSPDADSEGALTRE
jgi:hypothetical protein